MSGANENGHEATKAERASLRPDADRLRLAFDLHEAGVALQRQRLRRLHPDLDEEAIALELQAWLRREGEPGDAPGPVRPLPSEAK